MYYFKCYFFALIGAMLSLHAQGQTTALAYPVQHIQIDGDLRDWPALPKYRMEFYYGPKRVSHEDFSAQFMVAYNQEEGCLYVAVEVIDDEYVGDEGQSHTLQDHALLYIDRFHQPQGGPPVYYVAAEQHMELLKKKASLDPHHQDIQLENAEVKIKQVSNRIQYEWKIKLGDRIQPMAVLGIDHFMIDHDPKAEEEGILLWKDGFGKSQGAQRMGDVILMPQNQATGIVKGKVSFGELTKNERIDELLIVSTQHQNVWIKASVDTAGNFREILPTGTYKIVPNRHFTSPIFSSGFNQNTRKIGYGKLANFEIKSASTALLDSIQLTIIEAPVLPKEGGVLWQKRQNLEDKVDQFIKNWQQYYEIPAVSVALIQDNKLVYDKVFGVKHLGTNEPVTKNSYFEAASITKSVFAVMVLRLAERGIIDLDKPLHEYLPFPNLANDERAKLLTARIILNHQSGLPNWAWGGPGTWENGGPIQLAFEPGTQFGYSGEAFNYLGRVVEKITSKKLPQIFQEEVAAPFGLSTTYFYYQDAQFEQTATGHYQQYPNAKTKDHLPSPASSLATNAHDLYKFALGLMNEQHLKKSSYELIYTPQTVLTPEQKIYDPETPQYISHGFFVQDTSKGKLLAHGGNNGDYDCKFAYNPSQKLGYVVFTNSNLGDEFVRQLELFLLREN